MNDAESEALVRTLRFDALRWSYRTLERPRGVLVPIMTAARHRRSIRSTIDDEQHVARSAHKAGGSPRAWEVARISLEDSRDAESSAAWFLRVAAAIWELAALEQATVDAAGVLG